MLYHQSHPATFLQQLCDRPLADAITYITVTAVLYCMLGHGPVPIAGVEERIKETAALGVKSKVYILLL